MSARRVVVQRALREDAPALLAAGWRQVTPWDVTCGGLVWAWFERQEDD